MKELKAPLSMLLSLAFLFLCVAPCYAEPYDAEQLVSDQSDYEFLLSCGYSEEFLNSLSDDCHSKLRDGIGNNEVSQILYATRYMDEGSSIKRGSIDQDDLKLTVAAAEICKKGTNKITGYLVGVSWVWSYKKPINTLNEDALVINWDGSLLNLSETGFYSQDWYKETADGKEIISREITTPASLAQGGLGFFTKLKGSKPYVGGSAIMVFDASQPLYTGTNYSSNLNFEYAHDYSLLGLSGLGIGIEGVSVSLSFNVFVDTMASRTVIKFSK